MFGSKKIQELSELKPAAQTAADASPAKNTQQPTPVNPQPVPVTTDYAARKELQKRIKKAERDVTESEKKIARMEARLKELDQLLCNPENASDMTLVTEYTDTKRTLDKEVERWEQLAETLEQCQQELA